MRERRRHKTILKREVTTADLTFIQQVVYEDLGEEHIP